MHSEHEESESSNSQEFPDLSPGTLISHYEIINKLGSGGMGGVYLAEDTKLNRRVALKFLPISLSKEPETQKHLLREARAASKLNHQNIVSIYAIEETDDRIFMVMEYIEGRSLTELIASGELTLNKVMDFATQIAEGLAAAHGAGIVHCDVKPDNIAVTSKGLVKIMDFGVAKLKETPSIDYIGSAPGTLFYMSPEQAQREQIDHRSDIFSFGIVLYEMLTGKLPFTGEYEAAVIYSILNETPVTMLKYNPDIPGHLSKIVSKALEKKPDLRHQTASEIIAELKESPNHEKTYAYQQQRAVRRKKVYLLVIIMLILATTYGVVFHLLPETDKEIFPVRKNLAVLPLENLGNPDDEYFADGITDAITTQLAKAGGLGVISRSSAIQYKQTETGLRQIGSELGVDYILEGTVNWDKSEQISKVKINIKLIRVADDTHIWAESYEHKLEEIFVLQSNIADNVSEALNITLTEPESYTRGTKPTDNIQAYDFYLRGNMYFNRGWEERDLRLAITMYEKAVELDSVFALALAMLSRAHSGMYWDYYDRTDERTEKAKKAVDRALQIEPNLPQAKLALGVYYYSLLDYDKALEHYKIALRSQPNNSELIAAIAGVHRRKGNLDQAIDNYVKAFELDPRSYIRVFDIGLSYGLQRNYTEAVRYLDKTITLAPDWPMAYIYKAWLCLFWEGTITKAQSVLQEASGKADLEQSVYYWWLLRIIESDYQKAIARTYLKTDTTSYYLHLARLYRLNNQPQLEYIYCDSVRIILERKIQSQPENAWLHSKLGLAYAGLGLKEEAIRKGREAVEIMPPSREAIYGLFFIVNMAEIYTILGEYDKAVDQLEFSLSMPGFVSVPYLRLDPVWKSLHDHPRFKRLIRGD